MRKLISALGMFVFAGALLAQSPFAGTWKLDAAKTKYTTGEPSKDVTLLIEEQGDNFQVTATGTNADGSPLSIKYTVPIKGGDGTVQEGPYDAIHARRISDSIRQNTYMKSGKQVSMRRWAVSKDGKTLTSNVKGLNATGQTVAGTDVFDKQ